VLERKAPPISSATTEVKKAIRGKEGILRLERGDMSRKIRTWRAYASGSGFLEAVPRSPSPHSINGVNHLQSTGADFKWRNGAGVAGEKEYASVES
jgi:hypothetical protein